MFFVLSNHLFSLSFLLLTKFIVLLNLYFPLTLLQIQLNIIRISFKNKLFIIFITEQQEEPILQHLRRKYNTRLTLYRLCRSWSEVIWRLQKDKALLTLFDIICLLQLIAQNIKHFSDSTEHFILKADITTLVIFVELCLICFTLLTS